MEKAAVNRCRWAVRSARWRACSCDFALKPLLLMLASSFFSALRSVDPTEARRFGHANRHHTEPMGLWRL